MVTQYSVLAKQTQLSIMFPILKSSLSKADHVLMMGFNKVMGHVEGGLKFQEPPLGLLLSLVPAPILPKKITLLCPHPLRIRWDLLPKSCHSRVPTGVQQVTKRKIAENENGWTTG